MKTKETNAPLPSLSENFDPASRRILVIEDDRGFQHLYKSILESEGYTLITVSSGKEALEKIDQDFGLAIVDLILPDMSGTVVLEKLNARSKPIATIVISGFDDLEISINALNMGAFWYLRKPVHRAELLHILKRASAYINSVYTCLNAGLGTTPVSREQYQDIIQINGEFRSLAEVEREAIIRALGITGGNKARAARLLDISEKSIYNKMDRLGIKRSPAGQNQN